LRQVREIWRIFELQHFRGRSFAGGYADAIIETLREGRLGKERRVWVDEWAADNDLKSYAKSVQEQIDQLHDRWAV
jgi:hypothetical protein